MFWGTGVAKANKSDCETCRIVVSQEGIEIDSSTGNIVTEAIVLSGIVLVVALLYIGKKWIDKRMK
ncbi:MAG: hypothetical protein CMA64_06880 [Euryarchaeota archaeon]|nr:hypothetical protein [Euryarchaeota archaeon]